VLGVDGTTDVTGCSSTPPKRRSPPITWPGFASSGDFIRAPSSRTARPTTAR